MKLLTVILTVFAFLSIQAQQKSADQFLGLAKESFKKEDWDSAKDLINQCLILKPSLAEGYALRGEINEKLDKATEALTDYSIAIELSPELADAYLSRGVLAYKLNRFDLAKTDFKKLLKLRITETTTVYFRQSNNESVDKVFTLQSGIRDMGYNYLGLIESKTGENLKAIIFFDSAILVNPGVADYYAHRGKAFLDEGEIPLARKDFLRALEIDPNHGVSKNNLAVIMKREGNFKEAEKYLEEAKSNNSKAPDHFTDLALLQMESGRFKEAIQNFDSAIAIDPRDGELFINRGLAKEKNHDSKGAQIDFSRALKIDPKWPKAWFVQGNNFMKQKKWQQALENYTVAITYDNNYSFAYYNRAIVEYQLGQLKQACHDIRSAEAKGMEVDAKMKLKFCVNDSN